MTIRDIAEVTWTITRLDITARDESTHYQHRWIIGEKAPYIKPGSQMYWAVRRGEISIIEKKINAHNERKKNGLPEIGWGLDGNSLPEELLDAKITRLGMACRDGVEYEVSVDVELSPLLAVMLMQQMSLWEAAT